jgi:Zn-dependent protease
MSTEIETPFAPPPQRQSPLKRAGGAVAGALALIASLAGKLKAVLLLLPKLKLLTTSGSMLVSIGAYALIWGWQFAVGFVLLLFVHEMGHVIQLRREGVPATAPMFIPFLGAVVGMKRLPDDAGAEARVGLAGPVLGSLACLVPLALYGATGNHLFQALAFTGFFLNLFNLAPVLPLDGGRAMAALSPWMWLVGFGILLGVGIAFPNPIVILILVLGGFETYRRFKNRKTETSYYRVAPRTRFLIAAVYVGLAVALIAGMDATHLTRTFANA